MKFQDFLNSKFFKKEEEEIMLTNEQWGEGDDGGDGGDYDGGGGWFGRKKKKKKSEEGDEEKPTKVFNVGDIIILVDNKKSTKIPADAWDFLMTYKTFTVRKVNEKGKIDLGCHISKNTPEGGVEKIYMFSPDRFELQTSAPQSTGVGVQGVKEEEGPIVPLEPNISGDEEKEIPGVQPF